MLFSKFFWNFNFTFLILWSKFALYQRNCNFYSAMKDLKEKNYVLGIDMGGTNTEFAVVNARGEIVDRDSIPTVGHRDIYDYVARLKSGVEALVKRSNTRGCLRGIGVGAPCANRYTGCIEAATDLPWPSPIPLAALLEQAFSLPVSITNDANAAALGEMTYGAARGMKDFIMITLGTGVGSGIVINGQLVYGHDGFAGELGHVIMKRNNGRVCGCGRTGCLEAYCSATGVARTAREFLEVRTEPSLLRNIDIEEITSKDVYDAAIAGDKIAKDIFEFTGKILGEAMADMTAFSSPQAFVLFGGLTKSGDLLMKPLKEAYDKNVLPIFRGKAKILLSELKESDAAVLGASALGWEAKYRYEVPGSLATSNEIPAVSPEM